MLSADSSVLDRVVLSWPKNLTDASEVKPNGPRRSWIQLARTGQFTSKRYGKFEISKKDLSTMCKNFAEIFPKQPTELPIDYDHLSMDPKKPGDGIAAGWMKKVELREDGDELWAEVEWTEDGATRIAKQEYRFVSPSFVKNYTHKDGKAIGTTLLAAAITNHPFLEGMKALTLYNFSAIGDLAISEETAALETPKHLSEVGQRVMVAPGAAHTADEIGGTFEIVEVVGDGDDAFVTIQDVNGVKHRWFRATELLPASATPANPVPPNLVPGTPGAQLPNQPAAAAAVAQPKIGPDGKPVLDANGQPVMEEAAAAVVEGEAVAEAHPGVDSAAAAEGVVKKTVAPAENTAQDVGESAEEKAKKKARAAAGAVGTHKGPKNMSTMYKLRNDKNEEVEVSAEQLAAAGIQVVPAGHTAIPTSQIDEMKGSITNLSSRLDEMAREQGEQKKLSLKAEVETSLKTKLEGGFISKVTHDALFEQFKESTDLTAFRAIIGSFTTPIISLNTEHGSGAAGVTQTKGKEAEAKLIKLSADLQAKGMSLREATIEASRQLADEAEDYREQFAPESQRVAG